MTFFVTCKANGNQKNKTPFGQTGKPTMVRKNETIKGYVYGRVGWMDKLFSFRSIICNLEWVVSTEENGSMQYEFF